MKIMRFCRMLLLKTVVYNFNFSIRNLHSEIGVGFKYFIQTKESLIHFTTRIKFAFGTEEQLMKWRASINLMTMEIKLSFNTLLNPAPREIGKKRVHSWIIFIVMKPNHYRHEKYPTFRIARISRISSLEWWVWINHEFAIY